MKYFMSGVSTPVEFEILEVAGVQRILVDPVDLENVPEDWDGDLALDSGAYRQFKEGFVQSLDAYNALAQSRPFVHVFSKDVIGDEGVSLENWQILRQWFQARGDERLVPVWGWGGTPEILERYLDEAPLVAIGGLARLMRDKDEAMYTALTDLCQRYPRRFHLLGLNWVKAINGLKDLAFSADSSKWLDGGRYGSVFFTHTKTGALSIAPSHAIAELSHLKTPNDSLAARSAYRQLRLLHNAEVMWKSLEEVEVQVG